MTVYGIICCTCRSPNIAPADLPPHETLISQMTVYGISCCTCRSPNIVPADLPCHKTLISQMTVYGISHCTCRSPPWMAISQIPALTAHIYSYSESSTFGWPGVGISTPIKYWFHRWLFMGYNAAPADHPTLYLQIYPAIKHWFHRWLCMGSHTAPADLPLEWWFHRFLLWQLIFHSYSESSSFGRPGLGRTTPTSNGNSTDSCEIPISFLL